MPSWAQQTPVQGKEPSNGTQKMLGLPRTIVVGHCTSHRQKYPLELYRVTRDNWTMKRHGPRDSSPSEIPLRSIPGTVRTCTSESASPTLCGPLWQPWHGEPVPASTSTDSSLPPARHPATLYGSAWEKLSSPRTSVPLPLLSFPICLLGLIPQLPLLPRARASETWGSGP